MKGFSSIERRISANADQTRFRVQYKDKKGKPKGKVLKTLADARKLRDQTDIPGAAKKAAEKGYTVPKTSKVAKKPEMMQLDLSSLAGITAEKKIELVDGIMSTIGKILAL